MLAAKTMGAVDEALRISLGLDGFKRDSEFECLT